MSTRFIGKGNGIVIMCNHGTVHMGERQVVDSDGKPVLHKNGTPATEYVFPPKCDEKLTTGQILRSGIRAYAQTQKWLTVVVDGRVRDFCASHAPERAAWIANRKAERERLLKDKQAARKKAEQEKLAAWLAKKAEWKRKANEKAARSAAWRAKREAKKAAAHEAA